MQLLDMIFGERNVLRVRKNDLHRLGATRDPLFIAGGELFHFRAGKKALGFLVA